MYQTWMIIAKSNVSFFPFYNLEEFKLNLSEQFAVVWSKYFSTDIIIHMYVMYFQWALLNKLLPGDILLDPLTQKSCPPMI